MMTEKRAVSPWKHSQTEQRGFHVWLTLDGQRYQKTVSITRDRDEQQARQLAETWYPTALPAAEPSPADLRASALKVNPVAYEVVPERRQRRRDERVKAAVLARAEGRSEWSGEEFSYLTVHHVDAVADGGEDSIFNAIALTPNEHAIADREPEFNALLRAKLVEIEPRT